jgi:hypothetical protein
MPFLPHKYCYKKQQINAFSRNKFYFSNKKRTRQQFTEDSATDSGEILELEKEQNWNGIVTN